MKFGFIGTGSITTALVTGFCQGNLPTIMVSPRNAERAAALANEFPSVEVAADNQSVVDASDIVFLAVRPQDAKGIVSALRFRADQRVISLLPTFRLATILSWTEPVKAICRACPLPGTAYRQGPILVHGDEETREHLGVVGDLVTVEDEDEFHRLWTVTGVISPLYDVLSTISAWVAEQGVSEHLADRYIAQMTSALCVNRLQDASDPLKELAAEAQTPGGLNEQAARMTRAAGVPGAFREALEAIWSRFEGAAS